MNKLNVFSEKLGKALNISFRNDGVMVTSEGIPVNENGIVFAWNNTSRGWVNNGWNNTSGGWQNSGWNNTSRGWVNNGWNNTSGRWSDKGWSNSSWNWGNSGSGGTGCFITTVCVEHIGLTDDCAELQTLRKYRDALIQNDDEFRSKVLEYYRKAPLIIQEIEKTEESVTIYDELYNKMIRPCVSLLNKGNIDEAKLLYLDYYENLSERYLGK